MFADQTTIPLIALYRSGADPAVTYTDGRVTAGIMWLDTSTGATGTLKKRNEANSGWDILMNLDARTAVATKAADYATTDNDDVLFLNSPTDKTLSLIAGASRSPGRPYYVKNINSGVWTIDPSGAENIDGAATINLAERDALQIIWTGTAWETF